MFKKIDTCLRDNRGDGYIMLLIILMAGLVLFGGLFFVLETTIHLRNARRDVNLAVEEVFAVIRETGYGQLAAGEIDYITENNGNKVSDLTDKDIAGMLAAKSQGIYDSAALDSSIVVLDGSGKIKYTLTDIHYTFIDGESTTAHTYSVGDVNRDGTVNDADIDAINAYITGTNHDAVRFVDADVNGDGTVDELDVELVSSLINYYYNFKGYAGASQNTSTAGLAITFRMKVPLAFGDLDFGESDDVYAYTMRLSFKPAA